MADDERLMSLAERQYRSNAAAAITLITASEMSEGQRQGYDVRSLVFAAIDGISAPIASTVLLHALLLKHLVQGDEVFDLEAFAENCGKTLKSLLVHHYNSRQAAAPSLVEEVLAEIQKVATEQGDSA